MAMSKEQILKGIERAELALSKGTLSEGAKANLQKQVTQMKADLSALETATIKKEEVIEKKEQVATEDLDSEIAKCEAMLNRKLGAKIKEVFEKKLKEAKRKKLEIAQEAKEDKAEAKQELKEVKEAVKDIEKAVATGKATPIIKKPKIEEKAREDKSKKRVAKLQSAMTSLAALVSSNPELKALYEGKSVDLKRDAGRPAKPTGYRFTGRDYRVPTDAQVKLGKKRGTIDYEARPNRSDKYPKGYKGNIREKLADGGEIFYFDDWVNHMLSNSDYTEMELMDFEEHYENLLDYDTNTINFIKFNDSDGGMMAKGGTGGATNGGYNVFNYTDNIYATPEVFKTKKEATEFISSFRKRFEKQGYYRTANMDKISVEHIDLEIIPQDFNPHRFNDGGKTESHSDQMIDIMNKDRESGKKKREKIQYEAIDFHNAALEAPKKKKREKYTWDAEEDKMTGESEGERKAGMDEMADGGQTFRENEKVSVRIKPNEFAEGRIVRFDNQSNSYVVSLKGKYESEFFDSKDIKKMAKGGKLVGNQSKLDVNKNGKLDKEDFKMLRSKKSKMAKGGKIMRKNSPHRFCWIKDAVKDGIIKKEQLKDTPSKYNRKKYPAYIMEK